MRQRDDSKRLALLEATLKEVVEFGFSGTSVARIARSAGVSPGTLYIYYADKDALLQAAFFYVSDQIIEVAVSSFLQGTSLKDGLRRNWHELFRLGLSCPQFFRYHDSFIHSSWITPDIQARNEAKAAPILDAIERGKEAGLIKPVPFPLLETFMFRPIYHLVQRTLQGSFEATDEQVDLGFNMAWDALAQS